MHYLLQVPEIDDPERRNANLAAIQHAAVEAGRTAFQAKLAGFDQYKDEQGRGLADRMLSLVMLNVLDEKWKDHLYDLDQLRGAIQYRAWGQKDPLVEYKTEAYTMFVDLMHDIHATFAERFLMAQLVFREPPPPPPPAGNGPGGNGPRPAPKKRFNALGVLEETPEEAPASADETVMDVAPDEPPKTKPVAKADPVIVGAGRTRSLNQPAAGAGTPADWSSVGRNDPCPCGSGKKFKKCHGVNA
jgi:preprotein translocase subunit SecA